MESTYPFTIVVDEPGGKDYARGVVLRALLEYGGCKLNFLRHAVPLPLLILGQVLRDLIRIDYVTYNSRSELWFPTQEGVQWASES